MQSLFSQSSVRFVMRTIARLGVSAEDLEDVAQDVFVVAHRRAGDFDTNRSVEGWLYGITRNVVRSERRRAYRHHERLGSQEDAIQGIDPPESEAVLDPHVVMLRAEIAKLPESERDAIILCDLEGMKVAEAAEILDVPLGTFKDRLRKGRKSLEVAIRTRMEEAENV